jgi:hypothetical protein
VHARIVRFTDVDPDHVARRLAEAGDERPANVPETAATKVQIFHDEDQRTAVVIQHFGTADDMAAAEGPLDSMDPADTPGTRASVDRCELKREFD